MVECGREARARQSVQNDCRELGGTQRADRPAAGLVARDLGRDRVGRRNSALRPVRFEQQSARAGAGRHAVRRAAGRVRGNDLRAEATNESRPGLKGPRSPAQGLRTLGSRGIRRSLAPTGQRSGCVGPTPCGAPWPLQGRDVVVGPWTQGLAANRSDPGLGSRGPLGRTGGIGALRNVSFAPRAGPKGPRTIAQGRAQSRPGIASVQKNICPHGATERPHGSVRSRAFPGPFRAVTSSWVRVPRVSRRTAPTLGWAPAARWAACCQGLANCPSACDSSFGLNGLTRCASKPAARAAARSSGRP